jgi:hypothetical protein
LGGDGEFEPDHEGKGIREEEDRKVQQEFHNDPQAQDEVYRAGKKLRHAGPYGSDRFISRHQVPNLARKYESCG